MSNKKRIISIVLCAVFGLAVLMAGVPPLFRLPKRAANKDAQRLEFSGGEFRIIQVSDFHIYDKLYDEIAQYLDVLIEQHNPHLVVLTGDNIFPESIMGDWFLSQSLSGYYNIGKYFEQKGVRWSATFGNHDDQGVFSKTRYLKACASFSQFVGGLESRNPAYASFVDKENEMIGNFCIPVYNGNDLAYNVFLLDSGSDRVQSKFTDEDYFNYNYIRISQIKWFEQQNNYQPSLIFTHIPLPEYDDAVEQGNPYIGTPRFNRPSSMRSGILQSGIKQGTLGFFTGHMHASEYTTYYKNHDGQILISNCKTASPRVYPTVGAKLITLTTADMLITNIDEKGNKTQSISFYGGVQ